MTAPDLSRWRVVETRYSEMGHVTRVIHHTHISGLPMGVGAARQLATQETGRYVGARLRRSFRAEPVQPAWSDPNTEVTR